MTEQHADDVSVAERHHTARSRMIRLGPALLGLGLVTTLCWSVAVELARPSGFDPGEDCELKFAITDANVEVSSQFFPPAATCTFHDVAGRGTVTLAYIGPGTSVVLVTGLIIAALLVGTGLVLTALPMLSRSAHMPPADGTAGARWPLTVLHLSAVFLLGLMAMGLGPYVALLAGIFGDWFGSTALAGVMVFCVVGVAVALDAGLGPGRRDAAGSRRRGTALGLTGCGAILILILTGGETGLVAVFPMPEQPPIGPVWLTVSVALLFVAVAFVQRMWTTSTAPAQRRNG